MVYHSKQLLIWKIIQINGIPIWLLHRWTMITSNHLTRVHHTIKLPCICRTFQRDFIILRIWINLCKYFTTQFVTYGNITKWIFFIITSDLATRTLQNALDSQPAIKGELILHSDQGSQYTSKAFVEFCESVHVTQSMSKAGYPYDNAPMERYFNTLKNECTNLYEFQTEEALYQTVEEFAYVTYNHVCPHSFNGYRTPYQARIAS